VYMVQTRQAFESLRTVQSFKIKGKWS
ncbi:aminoglycoside N-acetyltransferase AAC(6')-IIc, partial [Salmonella enterica]|nr:aminoglycoside N-acetyltransferase AAC(6')-IIc [Salmonella enterica]EBF8010161.1 aminoglycoside N-acetyltransferase AAC(6')-IIc [Salmonella enterica]